MSDITKCQDHFCFKKSKCYRYLAEPHEYAQSYFLESPRVPKTNECDMFYPTSKSYNNAKKTSKFTKSQH